MEDPDRPVAAVSLIDEAERQPELLAARRARWPATRSSAPRRTGAPAGGRDAGRGGGGLRQEALTLPRVGRAGQPAGPAAVARSASDRRAGWSGLPGPLGWTWWSGCSRCSRPAARYLPLDPRQPADRLAYLIADAAGGSGPADPALRWRLAGDGPPPCSTGWTEPTRLGADRHRSGGSPADLAYVIYTSGSTGRPKGVLVEHANVLRLFAATERWFGFGPDDVWTLFHSAAFDFSVWEIWGALCTAAGWWWCRS